MTLESVAFDRAVEYYDQTRGFPPGEERTIAALIAQAGGLKPTHRVLEIGVGTGRIALPLSPYISAYFGVDISRPMMLRLRAKQRDEAVLLAQADATWLPFAAAPFDAAVAVHVFHLIAGWQNALAELQRALRPDAPLIHCWTLPEDNFRLAWDAWNAALPTDRKPHVGVQWHENPHFLEDSGWQPMGEALSHPYASTITPRQLLERVRGRTWSATWRVTDDELEQGIAAMGGVIQQQYPDADTPVTSQSVFVARAYLPPEQP